MTIVITRPDFFEGEAERITAILQREDVDIVHVRKPDSSVGMTAALIEAMPREFHGRLVLHDHHELAVQYGLRGIHLNKRNPSRPHDWKGTVSISCHSIDELAACKREPYDYFSLSPIFDSISKRGYRAAFSTQELEEARRMGIIDQRVMALGGVTFSRINEVMQMGFGGAMILGDAWKS